MKLIQQQYTNGSTLADECRRLNIPLNEINYKDQIHLPFRDGFTIINMANSSQKGSHWVSNYREQNKNYYFDSLGMMPPKRFMDLITYYNPYQIQSAHYGRCGSFNLEIGQFMSSKENKKRYPNPTDRFKAFLSQFKLDTRGRGNAKLLTRMERN